MSRLSASQLFSTAAVLAAMALTVLDAGVINVAVPTLSAHFQAAPSHAVLVVSTYQAALLVGLLPAAHIAGRFGNRRVFAGGVGLFCVAAIMCALAPTLPLLIATRAVQGLGAAAVMALGVALLRDALGSERLVSAIAWNALTVSASSAAGPTVGSAMLSVAAWPWLFLTGLPLGVAAMLACRALPKSDETGKAIDALSIALHAAAVILLVTAAMLAAKLLLLAIALAGTAAALLAVLVRRARAQHAPMFPADLLGQPAFAIQASAAVCCFIGQSVALVALPFHLQRALSDELLAMGLVITCWPLGVACTSFVAGWVNHRPDRATQCAAGGGHTSGGSNPARKLSFVGRLTTSRDQRGAVRCRIRAVSARQQQRAVSRRSS